MSKTNKTKENYPEIQDIRADLDSLKNNVIELTKHIKDTGAAQTNNIKHNIEHQISDLQKAGANQVKNVEKHVKQKPTQSLMTAFAVGLVASYLLRGRS
jgi:ElaB/YqjD/DUF883 family membrane-anchored ribosome-binding protein